MFGVGLIVAVVASLFAAGVVGLLASSLSAQTTMLVEVLLIVGATHLVFVCAGLSFADRDPRWFVMAVAFAILVVFGIGHLAGYLVDSGTSVGLKTNWAGASDYALSGALLVSVFLMSSRQLSTVLATLLVAMLLGVAVSLLLFVRSDQNIASIAVMINTGVYVVAMAAIIASLRSHGRDDVLMALGAAAGLGVMYQLASWPGADVAGYLLLTLRLAVFAALYFGLFVLALLRPYRHARQAEAFFRTLVESSPAAIVLSRGDKIVHANEAFLELMGFESLTQAREAFLWDLEVQDGDDKDRLQQVPDRGDRGEPNTVVRRLAARDGRIIHARVEHVAVNMPDGDATLTYFIDFSKTVEAQEQLKRYVNYDALTGLPNRAMLRGQLDQALRVAERVGDMVVVLFIDLDQFKQVNDTLGHASGDALLKMVARRLSGVCRKEDTLGRLGGDEFIIVGRHIQSRNGAATLAAKLIQALDTPFNLEGHEIFVGGSIGVSLFPHDAEDAVTMIRNADVAMYHAKRGGGPRVAFYEEEMNARALERLELGTELRWALERDEFELFYQPRVDLGTGRLAGAEALVRWRSPTRGLVLPEKFIPRLEELGLISQLGRQVLAKACHAAMEWRSRGYGRIPVAVNLSAAQFRGSVVEDVELALSASGLPHEDLELEITESLLFRDYEQARVPLEKLTAKGVRAALDDFGTGYSSLSSLHHLPVHFVKIDRSFVQALQPGRNTIVAAIVNVAHTLGMRVIAEGVETADQRDILIGLGCDEMQGHLFTPAISAEELPGWLSKHSMPQLFAVSDDS
ncbi:MAG: EAL domain-containing protein [Betaproteobacteria bacterium]|nr:MAG: EAL domain-containing protein [Betaproteobacteria bacterium]